MTAPLQRLFRLILAGIATLIMVPNPAVLAQERPIAAQNPCQLELADTEELCGWIDEELCGWIDEELCGWIDMATHDSVPLPTLASPTPIQVSQADADSCKADADSCKADADSCKADADSCEVDADSCEVDADQNAPSLASQVTTMATVACASAGVSVEQLVEPFAMVSTKANDTLASIEKFMAWWENAVAKADSIHVASDESVADESVAPAKSQTTIEGVVADQVDGERDLDDVDSDDAPASVDLESLGPSVLVQVGIEVRPISPLVGGAAMIATIEEAYMPYDLSDRDIKVWSVFPVATRPFCVRPRTDHLTGYSMWDELDEMVKSREVASVTEETTYACFGSADCILEELIWKLESSSQWQSEAWAYLDPVTLGNQCGRLLTRGTDLAKTAAAGLASKLKSSRQPREPSPAGAALLARAGALHAAEIGIDVPPSTSRIAEAPATTLR